MAEKRITVDELVKLSGASKTVARDVLKTFRSKLVRTRTSVSFSGPVMGWNQARRIYFVPEADMEALVARAHDRSWKANYGKDKGGI